MEVNGGEDFQEEGINQELIVQSEGKISGNGEFIERKKKLGDAKLNNKNHLNYYFWIFFLKKKKSKDNIIYMEINYVLNLIEHL